MNAFRISLLLIPFFLLSTPSFALKAPKLSLTTHGANVSVSWTRVQGASGYRLYYAPCPFDAGQPLGWVETRTARTFTAGLPIGSSYYVAVKALSGKAESAFSNIVSFSLGGKLASCTDFPAGTLDSGGGSPPAQAASYIPVEAAVKAGYVRYSIPPTGFHAVTGWMQAVDLAGYGVPGKVEVDWMRLYARVDGKDRLILEDNFDDFSSTMSWYGLYQREPWFAGDRLGMMPFSVESGALVLEPGRHPDRVFHWWNTSRASIPPGTTAVWLETRVRISGGSGVQAGIDYWKSQTANYAGTDVNNTEAGVSDWYGNSSSDWQIIRVGRP